jgi:glyoxylase-like metal-dependent hydrolase (beta-lactamase superfamily II)
MSVASTIRTINAGSNCFLVKTEGGFVLIDTGVAYRRDALVKQLERAGCEAGGLKLIVLTHGDSDHADNCAYLHREYCAPVGMHPADAHMVERGDMSLGRKARPDRIMAMGRVIGLVGRLMSLLRPPPFDRFSPDLLLEDGQSLSLYGLDATIVHLPGHSKGSIGVLTSDGNLFCGDLIYNFFKPNMVWIDDLPEANASIDRLRALNVGTVYPGHGKAFPWSEFAAKG